MSNVCMGISGKMNTYLIKKKIYFLYELKVYEIVHV